MSRRSLARATPEDEPSVGSDVSERSRNRQVRHRRRTSRRQGRYQRLAFNDEFVRAPDRGAIGNRRLPARVYVGVVFLTGILAVLQFYFLPRNLAAAEFGLAVLGLSVTQAALQFTDIGLINASLRSDVSDEIRVALRAHAVCISHVICVAAIVVGCGIGLAGSVFGYIAAAGCACGLLLIGGRAQASATVQLSDEIAATRHNVFWQNAPKIGSVVGSFGGTAIAAMLAAVGTSALFGRPHLPRRIRLSFLRQHRRLWVPGIAVSASGFLLAWVDTYTLSLVAGVAEAGDYQAIVRPLTGISYIYLPLIALIQAAFNARDYRRVKVLMAMSILLGAAGSASVAAFLVVYGHDIWPRFAFDHHTVAAAAVAATAMCASAVLGGQLVLLGRQTAAAINTSLGALVLAVVSVVTVREMGAFGAGLASAVAATLVVVAHGTVLLLHKRTERVHTRR